MPREHPAAGTAARLAPAAPAALSRHGFPGCGRPDRAGAAGRERAPMSRRDAFDRILQSLHAAAFDDERWPAASGLIDEAIGAHGSFLAVADGPTQNNLFLARMCSRRQRLRELEREYNRDYYPIDERLPRIRDLPDSRLTHVPSLSTAGKPFGSTPVWRTPFATMPSSASSTQSSFQPQHTGL